MRAEGCDSCLDMHFGVRRLLVDRREARHGGCPPDFEHLRRGRARAFSHHSQRRFASHSGFKIGHDLQCIGSPGHRDGRPGIGKRTDGVTKHEQQCGLHNGVVQCLLACSLKQTEPARARPSPYRLLVSSVWVAA